LYKEMYNFAGCLDCDSCEIALEIIVVTSEILTLSQKLAYTATKISDEEFDKLQKERLEFLDLLKEKVGELEAVIVNI